MADETLQAFQLGASLYDRAQTQKRMMEQFNLQLADQAMRKEHYDIQNKIATDNAKRTLDEQNAFNQDLPLIQDWQSLQSMPQSGLSKKTGTLFIMPDGHIRRELTLGQIRNGVAREVSGLIRF